MTIRLFRYIRGGAWCGRCTARWPTTSPSSEPIVTSSTPVGRIDPLDLTHDGGRTFQTLDLADVVRQSVLTQQRGELGDPLAEVRVVLGGRVGVRCSSRIWSFSSAWCSLNSFACFSTADNCVRGASRFAARLASTSSQGALGRLLGRHQLLCGLPSISSRLALVLLVERSRAGSSRPWSRRRTPPSRPRAPSWRRPTTAWASCSFFLQFIDLLLALPWSRPSSSSTW